MRVRPLHINTPGASREPPPAVDKEQALCATAPLSPSSCRLPPCSSRPVAGRSRRSGFEETEKRCRAGDGAGLHARRHAVRRARLQARRSATTATTTTITGKVYDPAGANALYNVMVYIPGGTEPRCRAPADEGLDGADGISVRDLRERRRSTRWSARSRTRRVSSTLEDVPVDKDVPIVIQVGKWRRQLNVDVTKKCEENEVPDRELRLPKNGTEGDMPQIAVTTRRLRRARVPPPRHRHRRQGVRAERHTDIRRGHVHVLHRAPAGRHSANAGGKTSGTTRASCAKYDMVMLSCEGSENNENKGGDRRPGARASMYDYLNAGGKVFATHYHYTWFKDSPQDEFKQVAQWEPAAAAPAPTTSTRPSRRARSSPSGCNEIDASSTLGHDLAERT